MGAGPPASGAGFVHWAGDAVADRGRPAPDPVRLEVFHHLLAAVCEEAGALLQRSAISPNIRERRDYSFALFDAAARLVAQAAHIPVHLGSAAESVRAVAETLALEPGDVAIVNDPFAGGTHLPDVTLVQPVFGSGSTPDFYLVARAHHADIGGATPGSMAPATELLAEGLVIPPVKLRARGEAVDGILRLIAANVRGPRERLADLRAQEAALALGARRVQELNANYGAETLAAYCAHLMSYSERTTRSMLAALPAGTYAAEDRMDDDGTGDRCRGFVLRVAVTLGGGSIRFDFRGTDPQAAGGINANRGIVTAACIYAVRCLSPGRLPLNDGVFRCCEIVTEAGSLVDPLPPAPVAGGNVETSQRLVDVVLAALAGAATDRIPAASAGTMTNLALGGDDFAFYETLPGGSGAGPRRAGVAAIQSHMTNTRNTPIEEFERRLPVRVQELAVRRDSGGVGARRGGDGLRKTIELLAPMRVSWFADRHVHPPGGAAGGGDGACGGVRRESAAGESEELPGKWSGAGAVGDRFVLRTPGGGGHGVEPGAEGGVDGTSR